MSLLRYLAPLTFFASGLCVAQQPQADNFYLKTGDRVLFYGDSITEQRLYTAIVEAYTATRYPKKNIQFINSGWGGDRVSGGGGGPIDTRIGRDILPFKPTVVTIMLGMNDGNYRPATTANDELFFSGYRHIVDSIHQSLPSARITAIKPSAYDNVTRTYTATGLGDFEYNEVLRGYGMWIGSYANTGHIDTADMNADVVRALVKANQVDPEGAKTIIGDRVHPSFAGHMLLAGGLLKAWGARALVSEVSLDASGSSPKIKSATYADVSSLTGGHAISWTELDEALPLPFAQWQDQWGAGPVALVLKSSDLAESLNRQMLKITSLHPGTYSLTVDGAAVGSFTSDQLAQGINLGLLKTPSSDQALKVYQLAVSQEEIHFDWWRNIQVPLADYALPESTAAITSLQNLEAAVEKKVHDMAQPTSHHFEVTLIQ